MSRVPIPIENEDQRQQVMGLVKGLNLSKPWQVTIEPKPRKRSIDQNKLQWALYVEAAKMLGDRTTEEVRGECKLTLAVPILRAENETFRERYDAIVKPLPYEQKLALMMSPLDMAVSSLLTKGGGSKYIDAIYKHFAEQGIHLTAMEELGRVA